MGQDPRVQRWVVLEFARERDRVASNYLGAGLAPLVGVLPDETDAKSRGDGLKMLDGLVEDSSAGSEYWAKTFERQGAQAPVEG